MDYTILLYSLQYIAYSFIVYIKTDYIYKDIVEDVKTKLDTSSYELDRSLPKEKNEKVIGLMKDVLS